MTKHGEFVCLNASGCLDALELERVLDGALAAGEYCLCVNMSGIPELTKEALHVLIAYAGRLKFLHGFIAVESANSQVADMIHANAAEKLLTPASAQARLRAISAAASDERHGTRLMVNNTACEVTRLSPSAGMKCILEGTPIGAGNGGLVTGRMMHEAGDADICIGLGAAGGDADVLREHGGELMAVGGNVLYQATSGGQRELYCRVWDEEPECWYQVAYSLVLRGGFSHFVRFRSKKHGVMLSELLEMLLDQAVCDHAAVVVAGRSVELVGTSVTVSPLCCHDLFRHPDVANNFSYVPEAFGEGGYALLCGLVCREREVAPMMFIREMGRGLSGHFHGALFDGIEPDTSTTEFKAFARKLFKSHRPRRLLHMVNDMRETVGAGESMFSEGVAWIGRISAFETAGRL